MLRSFPYWLERRKASRLPAADWLEECQHFVGTPLGYVRGLLLCTACCSAAGGKVNAEAGELSPCLLQLSRAPGTLIGAAEEQWRMMAARATPASHVLPSRARVPGLSRTLHHTREPVVGTLESTRCSHSTEKSSSGPSREITASACTCFHGPAHSHTRHLASRRQPLATTPQLRSAIQQKLRTVLHDLVNKPILGMNISAYPAPQLCSIIYPTEDCVVLPWRLSHGRFCVLSCRARKLFPNQGPPEISYLSRGGRGGSANPATMGQSKRTAQYSTLICIPYGIVTEIGILKMVFVRMNKLKSKEKWAKCLCEYEAGVSSDERIPWECAVCDPGLRRRITRMWGRGGLAVRLLASHLGELGSNPGGASPGFSRVPLVPDDAVGRRVFSGISRPPSLRSCSILTTLHPHRLSRPRREEHSESLHSSLHNGGLCSFTARMLDGNSEVLALTSQITGTFKSSLPHNSPHPTWMKKTRSMCYQPEMSRLKFHTDGHISYQLNFPEDWKELPGRPKPIKYVYAQLKPLYRKPEAIQERKFVDHQDLNLEVNYYPFYNGLRRCNCEDQCDRIKN
ncbi:hypothetical protein PR048_026905 [Dryococelus australis]|uniref:Uncharacterized protein n=1 Tax=Dryococelus australis TaxID=614101 RepID=A0ABQ9GMK6_9NEOP|nr:hypothetical protein PR048_026905 [Dryococelus australis]